MQQSTAKNHIKTPRAQKTPLRLRANLSFRLNKCIKEVKRNLDEILLYSFLMFQNTCFHPLCCVIIVRCCCCFHQWKNLTSGGFVFSTAERCFAVSSDGNPRARQKQTLYKQPYLLLVKKQVLSLLKYKSDNKTRKQLNESVCLRRVSLRETNKPNHIWHDFSPFFICFMGTTLSVAEVCTQLLQAKSAATCSQP